MKTGLIKMGLVFVWWGTGAESIAFSCRMSGVVASRGNSENTTNPGKSSQGSEKLSGER